MKGTQNILAMIVAATAVACAASGARPSLLQGPRVLAIRADPVALPAQGPVVLEALTHAATEFKWRGCVLPWSAATDPVCPGGELALGTGNPVTIDPPANLSVLHVRLDSRGPAGVAEPAILRLQAGAKGVNPVVELELATGLALPAGVVKAGSVRLRSRVAGGVLADGVNTFFATAGEFSPWHTLRADVSTWAVPGLPGAATLTVVVRDGAGGVGWRSAAVEVLP